MRICDGCSLKRRTDTERRLDKIRAIAPDDASAGATDYPDLEKGAV